MNSPDLIFKNIILTVAREKLKCVRKREYPLEYYFDMFCLMQNDVVKWESLKHIKIYNPKKYKNTIDLSNDYHYKSIQNEFYRWSKLDIFIEAHNRYLKKYYYILKPHLKKLGIRLYIDCTCVWNKYGVEYVAIHPEYRKKKATKIASLVDSDGDIISIINFIINETIESNDEHEYVKKTFSHDVKIIQELCDNIIVDFDKRKNVFIGGDKAFKTQEVIIHDNKKVTIVTSKRKHSEKQIKKMIKERNNKIKMIQAIMKNLNENKKRYIKYASKIVLLSEEIENLNEEKNKKNNYSKIEKEIFSERYKVEDNYKNLKKSERIVIRKDRKIKTYMSFIFMDELKRVINKYFKIINENELFKI